MLYIAESNVAEAAVKHVETGYGKSVGRDLKKVPADKDVPDFYGSANGFRFSAEKTDFPSTFGAYGWVLNEADDGVHTFISASHEDYPGVDLYLYPIAYGDTGRASLDVVRDDGLAGYHVSVKDADAVPDMTWHGLTFGASEADIIAAYGEPSTSDDAGSYKLLRYFVSDVVALEFYIYADGGMQAVDLTAYSV